MKKYVIRFIKEVVLFDKSAVLIACVFSMILAIADVSTKYLPKFFIDSLVEKSFKSSLIFILIYFFVIVVYNVVAVICSLVMDKKKEYRTLHFIKKLYEHTFRVKQEYIESAAFYSEYSMRSTNLQRAVDAISSCFTTFFRQIISIVVIIGLYSRLNFIMSIVMLIPLIINMIISMYVDTLNVQEQQEKQLYDKRTNILSRIFYQSNSIRDIKMLNITRNVMEHLCDTFDKRVNIRFKYLKKTSAFLLISSVITECIPIISMVVFGYYVSNESISLSSYYVYIALYGTLKSSVQDLLSLFIRMHQISIWTKDYYDYVDNKKIIQQEPENAVHIHLIETIEFKNVSFKYENSDVFALQNVSFKIECHQKVMVIGLNGSGKTTMLKLICGIFEPETGDIYINGINLKQLCISDIRKCVSILFQDYYIFPFTIGENIQLFSKNQAIFEQMDDLFKRLGLTHKVNQLKNGYDTGIKAEYYDDYTDFSGGEMQKIAIIRSFCKPASMLLLDEPLNNIDLQTESVFYDLISSANDKLVVLVSHSLKYAPQVDKILYLENGSLLAISSHNELLLQNEKYKNLYNEYAAKYL